MKSVAITPNPEGFFVFNEKMTRRILAFNSILWVQACGDYSAIHLKEKDFVVCSKNLGKIEDEFIRAGFVRAHRSHIININEVVTFVDRKVLLSDDTELYVSHREVSNFIRAYCKIKNVRIRKRMRSSRDVA